MRRSIAFLVVNGFSLFDIRKLYIDEFYDYYDETYFALENLGRIKEGSYDKIKEIKNGRQDVVGNLRKQMFKIISNKK